jgi:large subunit ribosomal protein L23
MDDLAGVIKRPIITEKTTSLGAQNKYVFMVAKWATKPQIKKAVEHFFGVKVEKVNTLTQRGKRRRLRFGMGKKPDWKKAIVTLREGDTISLT